MRRPRTRRALTWILTAFMGLCGVSAASAAGSRTAILVLKEHTVGSTSQAQQFVDRLMARVQKVAHLEDAHGAFYNHRKRARPRITAEQPSFGIMSLAAYLGLRDEFGLRVIGKAVVAQSGGQQYFLVSSSASSLGECKGQSVISDHFDDPRFVENVVSGGDFKLADFQRVDARRPVQTLKKVINKEASCALVDDAQLDYAARLDGGSSLQTVWSSKKLPALLVVAFKGADARASAQLKKGLSKICSGAGETVCKEAGIESLSPAKEGDFGPLLRGY